MEYGHSLLAFKQDIENRGLSDWIEAHISFMRPLHRYYGVLRVDYENLSFSGMDEKSGGSFELVIKIVDITGIHLGMITRSKDLNTGLSAFSILSLCGLTLSGQEKRETYMSLQIIPI